MQDKEGVVVEFSVLGPLEVRDGGTAVELSPKLRELLAVLLCRRNTLVTTPWLAQALWTRSSPRSAVKTLQAYVHHLRKALGPERLPSRPPGYVLLVRPGELDADRFAALLDHSRTKISTEQASSLLREALGLWRGEAYDGHDHLPAVHAESVRLTELRLTAIDERAEKELGLGRHRELIAELRAIVTQEPFRERSRAQLMLALYRTGRTTEALHVYHEGRQLLADEFGLDPGHALKNLEHAILTQDPSLTDRRSPHVPLY